MKKALTLIALALLVLIALNCDSTDEKPIGSIEEEMTPTGMVQGEVQAIEGVTIQVRLLKDGQLVAQTETTGNYQLSELEDGEYTIQFSAKGYEITEMMAVIDAGQTVSLDKVTLQTLAEPVAHLIGTLTDDKTGNPLPDILVKLTDESGTEYETLTSDDGVFTFENLPIDQTFTLTVMQDGFEDHQASVDAIAADKTLEIDVAITAIPVELGPGDGLSVGSQAPEFELPDSNDKIRTLDEFIGNRKAVIVFYRGGW